MKWLGQYIQGLTARFRDDVYLESIVDHGSDPDRFLTMDSSTGKVTYRTGAEVLSDIGGSSGGVENFIVTADSGSNQTISDGNTLDIAGGTDLASVVSATDTVTVNHSNVSKDVATSTASPAHGATFTAIDSLTTSATGHVTAVNTKTITLPSASGDLTVSGVDGANNQVLTDKGDGSIVSEPYFTFENTGNVSTLNLLSNQDTGDLFKIATTTHGATTVTTIDDNAAAADLTLTVDGSIVQNSTAWDINASGAATIDAGGSATITTTAGDGTISLVSAHTAGTSIHIDGKAHAGSIVDIDAGILDVDSAGTTTITSGGVLKLEAANGSRYHGAVGVGSIPMGIHHYQFKGYSPYTGGNWTYPEDWADSNSPFEISKDWGDTDIDAGSAAAGGAWDAVGSGGASQWFRAGHYVVGRDCYATNLYGWVTYNHSSTAEMAIIRIRPVDGSTSAMAPGSGMEVIHQFSWAGNSSDGNHITDAVDETFTKVTLNKGDVLFPMAKSVQSGKTIYFSINMEVYWRDS